MLRHLTFSLAVVLLLANQTIAKVQVPPPLPLPPPPPYVPPQSEYLPKYSARHYDWCANQYGTYDEYDNSFRTAKGDAGHVTHHLIESQEGPQVSIGAENRMLIGLANCLVGKRFHE